MKKDLEKIKKIYGFERKTELTNAKAAVVKALQLKKKKLYLSWIVSVILRFLIRVRTRETKKPY